MNPSAAAGVRVVDLPMVPGESGFMGHTQALRAGRLKVFEDALRTAPTTQMRLMGRRFVVLNTPEAVWELLVDNAKHTRKAPGLRMLLQHLGGDGLFMSEGDLWRRQRRLMAPLFQPSNLERYAAAMTGTADAVANTWATNQHVDLAAEMTRITMGIVSATLFGQEAVGGEEALGEAITVLLDWVNDNSTGPALVAQVALLELWERQGSRLRGLSDSTRSRIERVVNSPFLMPSAYSPKLRRALRHVDERLLQLITERRRTGSTRDDLLSRLLAAQDKDGSTMTDKQVRDEAATLFVAGHETTANALAWSLHLLARNPQVKAQLQQEISALNGQTPGFADVLRLPLAIRVFKEAMRLYPPLTVLVRQATAPFMVGGVALSQGQIAFVPTWSLHRNPDIWPNPERFDPDRFLPENEAGRHRAAWLPFGIGPRVCIGSHFAMLEGPLVLARLLQRVDFDFATTQPITPDDFATLRPRGGVWAKVSRLN